ncbi:hypothetical protein JQC91_02695 [Jannaschia sp. Os4]|uniref:zinc ribbon domain-containing protein n=1 Tax=Jannaschia sp. Os4 TaxID=2807617 RepID=UPI00193ABE66|nr:hypothetical protein [Jannaschia sp. Os4]MBM2575203.1 hypothetical protein [Jannaschia sp. Os4]
MAMTTCAECGHDVSTKATKCPSCGARLRKPRRGFFGSLFKWAFILFNVLMAVWIISYWSDLSEMSGDLSSEAERAGAAVGGTIGSGVLLILWVIGDIILGLLVLFTRPRD